MNSKLINKVFLTSRQLDEYESFVLDDLLDSDLSEDEIDRILNVRAIEERYKQNFYLASVQ